MNILPLIIGLFLFASKNSSSKLLTFLNSLDLKEVLSLLKELGVAPEITSLLTNDLVENLSVGKFDLKTFLPLLINLLSPLKKQKASSAKKVSPLDGASGEIKSALFSYLNK